MTSPFTPLAGKKECVMPESIRVVVADDSPFVCDLIKRYLESDPAIEVIRTATDGKEAVRIVEDLRPDVVTLDLDMPVLSGLDALTQIMTRRPTAVVLISGMGGRAAHKTTRGLQRGAVDYIFKFTPGTPVSVEALRREMVAKVKAAARIKVIRSIPSMETRFDGYKRPGAGKGREAPDAERAHVDDISRLVVIGASTGGPLALKELLFALDGRVSFPLVIVQHMPESFTAVMAEQFNRLFPFPVREAAQNDPLIPGAVLVAPGDRHLIINPRARTRINRAPRVNGHRPSIDVTMRSAARAFRGRTTGVILTGMGTDGASGLMAIKNEGGSAMAQSRETCVIDAMPGAVIENGVAGRVGSPGEIGRWLAAGSL